MIKSIISPAIILASTIIGAGFFALPYVFERSGIVASCFYLLLFGGVLSLVHLLYADIILKTKEHFHFAGLAKHYLGKLGFVISILSVLVGMVLSLVAYIALTKNFLLAIFPSQFLFTAIISFWALSSLAIFINPKKLAKAETLAIIFIIFIITLIAIKGAPSFNFNFSFPEQLNYWFLPYAIVLFSLSGRAAIPAMIGYFKKENLPVQKIKSSIFLGTFLPAILYFFFAIGVLGIVGNVQSDGISEIISKVSPLFGSLFAILGIFSLWSTYIVIGRDLEKSFKNDLKVPSIVSASIVCGLPILLYALGFNNFLSLIGFLGGVLGGIEGILVILIWQQALKNSETSESINLKIPKIILLGLAIIFLLGIICSMIF